jgi:hypothetical protein
MRALISFEDLLRGQRVRILTDSATVKAELTRGDSKNEVRRQLVRGIWKRSVMEDILFTVEWIPGSLNDLADRESRAVLRDDWVVRRNMFQWLDSRWGPHSVDRFADSLNSQLPRFNSARACPGSEAVDCFAQDWSRDNNWVVPPFGLIHYVLLLIEEQGAEATVVVPRWEGQAWWPLLVRLASEFQQLQPTVFLPGPSRFVEPWKNPAWTFLAAKIPGATERRMTSRS